MHFYNRYRCTSGVWTFSIVFYMRRKMMFSFALCSPVLGIKGFVVNCTIFDSLMYLWDVSCMHLWLVFDADTCYPEKLGNFPNALAKLYLQETIFFRKINSLRWNFKEIIFIYFFIRLNCSGAWRQLLFIYLFLVGSKNLGMDLPRTYFVRYYNI